MKCDKALQILASQKEKLIEYGVEKLALFGSVVRDEANANNDIDILVEFEGPATFDQYMALKLFLEELFRCQIDLVTEKALKPRLRPMVESEALYVA